MWVKKLWGRYPRGPAKPRRQPTRRRNTYLAVVDLENKTVPSSFTAASVSGLIADINAANKLGGSNTIALSAPATSPYVLTGAYGNNNDGATGLPTIALNDNLIIAGNGDIIEHSTTARTPPFRLFDVASGGALTLQNLTLQGGLAFGSGVSAEGGAIYHQGALALTGVTVQNNIAQGSDGTPTIKGSGKTNAAGDGAAAAGGDIYSGSGTLTLDGATVQGNQVLGGNGGTPKYVSYFGDSSGSGSGGGIYVYSGTVSLSHCTLSNNRAAGGYGGNGNDGSGGGLCVLGGTVSLTNTTGSNNVASGGSGGVGGYDSPGRGGGRSSSPRCIAASTRTWATITARRSAASSSRAPPTGSRPTPSS
jgi:hypothetical protein